MVVLDLSRLDDVALMDLRDDFESLPRPWRELAVLAQCCSEPAHVLARLPLGRRDRLLLQVRGHLFGGHVDAECRCETCGERLDLTFDLARVLAATSDQEAHGELRRGEQVLRLRAPDSADIAAASEHEDPEGAILSRCVEGGDARGALDDPTVRDEIARTLAAIDPDAEITLTTPCPGCGATAEHVFDPAGFLLAEIVAHTDRLLAEVDQLARVYGWNESDILALGPRRRRRYLEITS